MKWTFYYGFIPFFISWILSRSCHIKNNVPSVANLHSFQNYESLFSNFYLFIIHTWNFQPAFPPFHSKCNLCPTVDATNPKAQTGLCWSNVVRRWLNNGTITKLHPTQSIFQAENNKPASAAPVLRTFNTLAQGWDKTGSQHCSALAWVNQKRNYVS